MPDSGYTPSMEHKPIQELVMPMDCFYGECDHDGDDHEVTMTVCDTCREVLELEELESFVLWPCEHEVRRLSGGQSFTGTESEQNG